jgi:hypothetical protein
LKRRASTDWPGTNLRYSGKVVRKRGAAVQPRNERNDTAVLSLSPPGLHYLGPEQVRRLARTVNEHAATLRSTHPTRYGYFASLPMPDVDGTLAEIDCTLDRFGRTAFS